MKIRPPPPDRPESLPGRPVFSPADASPCLCGSGNAFARCCKDRLPGYQIGAAARAAGDDLEAALRAKRADLAQYTILHKSNTAPVMARDPVKAAYFLRLDLNALSEIVGQICILHHRLGRSAELPAMLERLRGNVKSPLWDRKITYHQALIAHQQDNDDNARLEFAKLLPIEASGEPDIEIIQLYIPLYGGEISFSRMIGLCDRILELTKAGEDKLQYTCLKGFMYAVFGDEEASRAAFEDAVAAARETAAKHQMTERAKELFAGALVHLGSATDNQEMLEEAAAILQDLLADEDAWTPFGRARLLADLGDCYRSGGLWAEGEQAYRDALAAAPRGIAQVFLAECIARQNRIAEAASTLDAVSAADLDEAGKYDWAYLAAIVAAEMHDTVRIKTAIEALKAVKATAPLFEQRRLKLLLHLNEVLGDAAKAVSGLAAIRRLFAEPLRAFNRYAIMQPALFGFGVNLNVMLEDLHGKADEKKI